MHLSSLFLSLKSTWKDESIDVDHDKSIHLSACLHISNFFLPSLYRGCQVSRMLQVWLKQFLSCLSFDRQKNCKILWEIVRRSDPIYLPKFNFFVLLLSPYESLVGAKCHAMLHRFLLGKIKGENRVGPKEVNTFYGWPDDAIVSWDTSKICLSLTTIFPQWLFSFFHALA